MRQKIKETILAVRAAGCSCSRTREDEYRVNLKGGDEATAYYTQDAEDAIDTARAMVNEARGIRQIG